MQIGKLKSRMAERMAAYGTPAARIQTQLGLTKVGGCAALLLMVMVMVM